MKPSDRIDALAHLRALHTSLCTDIQFHYNEHERLQKEAELLEKAIWILEEPL